MIRNNLLAATLVAILPLAAVAKDGDEPPKQTNTTQNCFKQKQWDPQSKKYVKFSQKVNGVWDASIKKCVRPDRSSHLDEDTLYRAVREVAYAGRYEDAITILDQMPNQQSDLVMTYRGFTARKMGNLELANAFYEEAIALNPNNITARSYMGQGFVEAGDKIAAMTQLREIRARGGVGTWSEQSLARALETGKGYNF